jgi:hypothetical protein
VSYPGRSPRCFGTTKLGTERSVLNNMEKSAEGIVGGAPAEGPNDERQRLMTKRDTTASDHLPTQAAALSQDERVAGLSGQPESIHTPALLAQVLDRANLPRALKQVRQNKGAPGIDGMTVDALPDYLRHHWLEIRAQLEAGRYQPQPASSAWTFPSQTGRPDHWAFLRCWTASSNKPSRKVSRRNGNLIFIHTATASGRNARRTKRYARCKRASGKAMAGWWTWTCKRSLIESITTG